MTSTDPSPSVTFVVGAGASKEVHMPTGYELKTEIANSLNFEVDDFGRLSGGNTELRQAIYSLGQSVNSNASSNDYLKTSRLVSSAMPQAPSIDNFIDSHRGNKLVAEVGKLAIASAILRAERKSLLYVDPSNSFNTINFKSISDTWFTSFFQLLTLNTSAEDVSSRLSKVCIVSFNYDRTLEHFLYCSLQNYYSMPATVAAAALSNLRIFHPYGSIGALPWQSDDYSAAPFGAQLPTTDLLKLIQKLRTFTEGTDPSSSDIESIRSLMKNADQLVFLGFAYHELNLEVLFGSEKESTNKPYKKVYGSAFGLSDSDIRAIATDIANLGQSDYSSILLRRDLTAAKLLTEYSRSLRI
jgi:hypothetical protein